MPSQLTPEQLLKLQQMIDLIDNEPVSTSPVFRQQQPLGQDIGFNQPTPNIPYNSNADNRSLDEVYGVKKNKNSFEGMNRDAFNENKSTFTWNGRKYATWNPVSGKVLDNDYERKQEAKKTEAEENQKAVQQSQQKAKLDIPFLQQETSTSNPVINNSQPIRQDLKQESLNMFYNIGKKLGYNDADIKLAMDKRNMYIDKYKNIRNKISMNMGDWGKSWGIH